MYSEFVFVIFVELFPLIILGQGPGPSPANIWAGLSKDVSHCADCSSTTNGKKCTVYIPRKCPFELYHDSQGNITPTFPGQAANLTMEINMDQLSVHWDIPDVNYHNLDGFYMETTNEQSRSSMCVVFDLKEADFTIEDIFSSPKATISYSCFNQTFIDPGHDYTVEVKSLPLSMAGGGSVTVRKTAPLLISTTPPLPRLINWEPTNVSIVRITDDYIQLSFYTAQDFFHASGYNVVLLDAMNKTLVEKNVAHKKRFLVQRFDIGCADEQPLWISIQVNPVSSSRKCACLSPNVDFVSLRNCPACPVRSTLLVHNATTCKEAMSPIKVPPTVQSIVPSIASSTEPEDVLTPSIIAVIVIVVLIFFVIVASTIAVVYRISLRNYKHGKVILIGSAANFYWHSYESFLLVIADYLSDVLQVAVDTRRGQQSIWLREIYQIPNIKCLLFLLPHRNHQSDEVLMDKIKIMCEKRNIPLAYISLQCSDDEAVRNHVEVKFSLPNDARYLKKFIHGDACIWKIFQKEETQKRYSDSLRQLTELVNQTIDRQTNMAAIDPDDISCDGSNLTAKIDEINESDFNNVLYCKSNDNFTIKEGYV